MTQEQYGMWLCSIEGIGSQTIRKLINRFGTPEEVYTRTEEQLKEAEIGDRERKLLINGKRQFHYRAMKQKISSYDMDVISYFSERYPEKLRHIPDFPKRLYWRGKLPREELQIAIVGARNCSHYGREMARRFAYELSGSEIGVISGMARGIDGWAHQGGVGSRREYLCHIGKQCRNLLSQRTCKVVSKYCTKRWCLVRISTGDTGDARIFSDAKPDYQCTF